jgi:hypothetical protein
VVATGRNTDTVSTALGDAADLLIVTIAGLEQPPRR